jgi:formylglycine-generating enzyme required for sulfatase activity
MIIFTGKLYQIIMKVKYLFLFMAVFILRETCFAQKKVALVIGNASYTDVPLRNSANDATDMATTLRELGFTVTLKTNLNKRDMETAVRNFRAGLAIGDIALFYYSGHGMQVSGSNYLIPVGESILSETDVRYNAMEAQYVMDNMQDAGTSVNIIILDACRDNPFKGMKSQSKGFVAVMAPQGTFIAYATAPGSVAADGTGRNSPYTRNLIACMKMPGTEIESAFKEVRKKVMQETGNQQVPWESSSLVDPFAFKGMPAKPGNVTIRPTVADEQTIIQVGSLKVTTEIAGALYVDGTYMKQVNANTAITLNNLTEGAHTVKISGDETVEKDVAIRAGETASLTLDKRRSDVSSLVPDMVHIQGGTFQMGRNGGESDEKPVHSVTVSSFWIGKYEVTQKQWRNVMGSNPPELYFKGCDQCPVEKVSWDDIREFISKLNQKTGKTFRLPTEAEWEFAAKGGNQSRGYTYSGSNNVDEVAWYYGNSGSNTHPVGQKKPNELGLHDMSGNVWEWCSDWYGSGYYRSSPSANPKGPSTGSGRVIRGGSWGSILYCSTASRYYSDPGTRGNSLGFRLVLVP